MVEEDPSGLCGFCKVDVSAPFKLMATQLPGQTDEWTAYFAMLSNEQLLELEQQLGLEKVRRTGEAIEANLQNRSDQTGHSRGMYGSEPPAHHRRPDGRDLSSGNPVAGSEKRYEDDHLRI